MNTTKSEALDFFRSPRGQYIVSHALYVAARAIMNRPPVEQEPSNAADMDYLRLNLFPIYSKDAIVPAMD